MQVGTRSSVTKLMKRRTPNPTHPSARGRPQNHSEGAIYLEHDRSPGEGGAIDGRRSEEHTSELQSLMRISYAVFCLKKQKKNRRVQIVNTLQYHNDIKHHILHTT